MPDWCGHAWPTGPGQNEPRRAGSGTGTGASVKKHTYRGTIAEANALPWNALPLPGRLLPLGAALFRPRSRAPRHARAPRSAAPASRAVPVLTVVTTDADADADARRGHAGYGTYSPPTGVAGPMYARATELSAPRRPLGLSSLDISYPLFRQQARCRCRRPGRRVRVVLQLLAERVNGHSTPSTLARSAPRPRRRSEKR